jgi:hypothetical protein
MTGPLIVLDPTEQPASARAELAPRPASVRGRVLGVLDNGKPNSDRFLQRLVQELDDLGLGGVVWARKPSIGRLAPAATIADLATRCDLVITGVGDCAGCCSCTVQDGIALERRGVPTVVVCTSEFLTTARIAAAAAGIPDYPFTVIDHPLGSLSASQLAARARHAHEQIPFLLPSAVAEPAAPGAGAA